MKRKFKAPRRISGTQSIQSMESRPSKRRKVPKSSTKSSKSTKGTKARNENQKHHDDDPGKEKEAEGTESNESKQKLIDYAKSKLGLKSGNTKGTPSIIGRFKPSAPGEETSDSEVDPECTGFFDSVKKQISKRVYPKHRESGVPEEEPKDSKENDQDSPDKSEDVEMNGTSNAEESEDPEGNTNGMEHDADSTKKIEDQNDQNQQMDHGKDEGDGADRWVSDYEAVPIEQKEDDSSGKESDAESGEEQNENVRNNKSSENQKEEIGENEKKTNSEIIRNKKELKESEAESEGNRNETIQSTKSPENEKKGNPKAIDSKKSKKRKNGKKGGNQMITPYQSVEEYLFNDGDAQKGRRSLRSATKQKIQITPIGDNSWYIIFAESHLSTSDKKQIKKLIENAFDRSYANDAMNGLDQNPLKFIVIKNEKNQIISCLSYIEQKGLWFMIRTMVTMKGYDPKVLGSMLVLALQWQFRRKELDFYRLHAEVDVDDAAMKAFYEQTHLKMVNVEKYNKRLSVIDNKVKQNQDLCEYIWIGTVEETEAKLLEYLNMCHFEVPSKK